MTDIDIDENYSITAYEYLKYAFDRYFTFNTNFQINYANRREKWYRARPQLNERDPTRGTDYTNVRYDWSNENYLSYKRTFNRDHEVSAMAGASFQSWYRETVHLVGLDYTTDDIYTLNAASSYDIKGTYSRIYEHRMASFYGRAGYNYKSRYLFNATMRYDGSSRFGSDNRWGAFPSASVAWRFSDEYFTQWMKPFVSDAKARFSYGVTGNEQIGDYVAMNLYAPDYIYESSGKNVSGIGIVNLGFEGLGWEETTQFNAGLDLRLSKNKFNIVADYYRKNTDRLLNRVQLPKETGFSTMYKNVGAMSNEGYELSVDWEAIRKKKFRLSFNFNISTNDSRITEIGDGVPFYKGTGDAVYVYEGARLGEFWGYKHLGVFSYNESNAYSDNWEKLTPVFDESGNFRKYTLNGADYIGVPNQKKDFLGRVLQGGDIDFEDVNKDGKIDDLDKSYIGCAQADFFGGASATVGYRNLSLYVSLYYSTGGQIYNYAEAKRNFVQYEGSTPSPDFINNMWTKPGDVTDYPAPYIYEHNSKYPSDFYLEDASYIKIRNVKLSYDFSPKLLKNIGLRSAVVSLYGKNLLTFTDYKGYDPEFSDPADPLLMGIDTNRYPRKREFGFTVNLGF
jgi:TonB-linked SusC/RagA family outer membrane protein